MSTTDDVARLAREAWRLNQMLGWGRRLGWDDWNDAGGTLGRLAKASGATPAQVQGWMDGEVQPTTAQALAVLDALPLPQPVTAVNGHAPRTAAV